MLCTNNSINFFICNMYMDVYQIVETVFSQPPKLPCSFELVLGEANLFQVLMAVLIQGTRKLYGRVSPLELSSEQVSRLKRYIESLGYFLKYKLNIHHETLKPYSVDIWFVPYIHQYNCHGIPVYNN